MGLNNGLDQQVELAVEQIRRSFDLENFTATVRGDVITVSGDVPDRRSAANAMNMLEATVARARIVSRLRVQGTAYTPERES